MAAQNADAVRFAPDATLYVASVGAVQPTDVSTAWGTSWVPLGYTSSDGIELTPNVETESYTPHQSLTPIKTILTSANFELSFTMSQFDADTTGLYFFGGTWVAGGTANPDVYTLDVSSSPTLDERALGVEWEDGAGTVTRLVVARGLVTNREALTLARANPNELGVTFQALSEAGKLCSLITNADMSGA